MDNNTAVTGAVAFDEGALAAIEGTALAAVLKELKDTGSRLDGSDSSRCGSGAHMASLKPAGQHMASLSRRTK